MQKVEERLFAMQDLGYRDFHAGLMPTVPKENIIGVRTPALRAYARAFAKDPDARVFLEELPHRYYEENNLHAALLGHLYTDVEEMLGRIDAFLPYVDNWATCDTLAPKLLKKYPERVYAALRAYLQSAHAYTVRFAIVTTLSNYLDENFRPETAARIAAVHSTEYYVNMALAWYWSFALIKQYETALPYLREGKLEVWVHNKAIQKAVESYRIDAETKAYLRTLRR